MNWEANNIFAKEHRQQEQQQGILKTTVKATHPTEESYISKHTLIIDSRQRDCNLYKSPSHYKIKLDDVYKNITSVELKGAIIPRSSYNVHSSNNKIDFSIGSMVTGFKVLNGGSGYTVAPQVYVSNPVSGVTATATAIINLSGVVTNIIVVNPGSGYLTSVPPLVSIDPPPNSKYGKQATAVAIVGTSYTATLRPGQYTIGGNPVPGTSDYPSGLVLEIQNAMNYAVNGGVYDPISNGPFAVRLVSQYPTIDAVAGTPEAFDTNSCLYNRLQFINLNNDHWEFLFCSGENKTESANSILGFNINDVYQNYLTTAITVGPDTLIPAGSSIRANFDYNLNNDPDYVVLEIKTNDKILDRLQCSDSSLDRKFATLIFDNNAPDCLQNTTGNTEVVGNVQFLSGPVTKGPFWLPPGRIKGLKGYDFDSKKISFRPPEGKINSLTVTFTKYGLKAGGSPLEYNFEGREHTLIFEISAQDQYSQQKD